MFCSVGFNDSKVTVSNLIVGLKLWTRAPGRLWGFTSIICTFENSCSTLCTHVLSSSHCCFQARTHSRQVPDCEAPNYFLPCFYQLFVCLNHCMGLEILNIWNNAGKKQSYTFGTRRAFFSFFNEIDKYPSLRPGTRSGCCHQVLSSFFTVTTVFWTPSTRQCFFVFGWKL